MKAITSLPDWAIISGCLLAAGAVAWLGFFTLHARVRVANRGQVHAIAAPLMPALGALFAVLAALTLSNEAGYLRSAQDVVSNEAADASRLAWAATSPGVDTASIQHDLSAYLVTTTRDEWKGTGASEGMDPATRQTLARLEQTVRAEASRAGLGTATGTELLSALDDLSKSRRARIADASRQLPVLYVVTLAASGVALLVNAAALTLGAMRRVALTLTGLSVVVGLSLALLFAITAPYGGPLTVSRQPIARVVQDLRSGFFSTASV